MIDTSQKYVRLFRIQGLRFLVNDIWMGYYHKFNILALINKDTFTSYLPGDVLEKKLDEGLLMFSNAQRFDQFQQKFNDYMHNARQECEIIIQQKELTYKNTQRFFSFFTGVFRYYSKTEFFYTDAAFRKSSPGNDVILQQNVKTLGELKQAGRETLNAMFFGEESFLHTMLFQLSQKFNVAEKDLLQYGVQEILELFDGKKVPEEIIQQRNKAIVMIGIDQKTVSYVGNEAQQIIDDFLLQESLLQESNSSMQVQGSCAHTGKVRGKVKVIVPGYDNYDQVHLSISQMNKGDVLVSETTSPELLLACHKASAIVTNQGGLLSHAAIISRELGIPCIVGTGNATTTFKDGDLVEVDADNGIVRKLTQ